MVASEAAPRLFLCVYLRATHLSTLTTASGRCLRRRIYILARSPIKSVVNLALMRRGWDVGGDEQTTSGTVRDYATKVYHVLNMARSRGDAPARENSIIIVIYKHNNYHNFRHIFEHKLLDFDTSM